MIDIYIFKHQYTISKNVSILTTFTFELKKLIFQQFLTKITKCHRPPNYQRIKPHKINTHTRWDFVTCFTSSSEITQSCVATHVNLHTIQENNNT